MCGGMIYRGGAHGVGGSIGLGEVGKRRAQLVPGGKAPSFPIQSFHIGGEQFGLANHRDQEGGC